jgi:hypothetical protein
MFWSKGQCVRMLSATMMTTARSTLEAAMCALAGAQSSETAKMIVMENIGHVLGL